MIQFNELRITPDNKELIIDVSVKDLDIYTNVYLDYIMIDNQDTFIEDGPSDNPIYTYTIEDAAYSTGSNSGIKQCRLTLTNRDVNLSSDLLFIYVVVKGVPAPSTPCNMDNATTMGVVYNLHNIFQSFMPYIREVENDCNLPKGFINYILRFKALELAFATGNYTLAVKYWNRFFKDKLIAQPSTCNCPYATT